MKKPELPDIDTLRLSALHALNILDTEPEERFDRLTRMCRRVFNVPIALVSLVDTERQWFKSCQGLPVRETPRDISFCGHAILGEEIFVIENALEDERFFDNPLVTDDPHIRFYAGCPLRLGNGLKLGTLCIIDREPREFTAEDGEILRDLAAMVENELDALQLSTTDELTKISNNRGFRLLAPHYLNFCKREKLPATLAFIDLDDFKIINDTWGHAEGDDTLVTLSRQMQECFRQTDLIARLGGDEFVVLFSSTARNAALDTLATFSHRLKQYCVDNMRAYEIKFSYGVVQYQPERHLSIDSLLADGDSLMYECKRARKGEKSSGHSA